MGSGVILKRAQEKYGIENFSKEILEVFDNPEDMFNMESKLVNEDFVKDKETYNIKLGGYGGFDFINKNNLSGGSGIERFAWYVEKLKDDNFRKLDNAIKRERIKRLIYEGKIIPFNGQEFKGKKHTEESKKKIGEKNSKHQKGSGNSQFGMMWIYSLEEKINKKIPKDDIIPDGWLKGRKMKF